MAKLQIKQIRSAIDRQEDQKRTIRALGIKRLHRPVVQNDTCGEAIDVFAGVTPFSTINATSGGPRHRAERHARPISALLDPNALPKRINEACVEIEVASLTCRVLAKQASAIVEQCSDHHSRA